jgi:hypothetical protein
MPHYPRSDPTPIGPTAMPSPPPFASRPHPYTATPAARDSNLDSGNHDMSRLSTPAYPNDAPNHGLADIPLAYSQRILGVAPSPLALARQDTATHTASNPNNDSGTHDMSRLSKLSCPNDAPIHGLAEQPLRLLLTGIGCGTLAPRSQQTRHSHTTPQLRLY